MPLALTGLWSAIIIVSSVGLLVLTGYAIWQMRSDEGWEERVPPPKDG
jgi:hypothetical protein